MASVSKESRSGKNLYRVQWRDSHGRRKSMRLGGVSRKDAEHIASKVQALVNSQVSGRPWDADLSHWAASLGDHLAGRLADHGLIERRVSAELGPFIDEYIANRSDGASNTVRNWRNTREKLVAFFGEDRDLRDISKGDADDWRQALVNHGYVNATLSKAVKHSKQFLKAAVHKKLCDSNPFAHLKGACERDDSRLVFVPRETIARALDAAPDAQWRVLIALCRYGGLRCPSEVLRLEWQHIDWENARLTVQSPKTRRHNKSERLVPMFPELRPHLEEAFDLAPEGSRYVIERYRDSTNSNLRTQFTRIVRRAGLSPGSGCFRICAPVARPNWPMSTRYTWLRSGWATLPRLPVGTICRLPRGTLSRPSAAPKVVQGVVHRWCSSPPQQAEMWSKKCKKPWGKTAISAVLPEVPRADQHPLGEANIRQKHREKSTFPAGSARIAAPSRQPRLQLIPTWQPLSRLGPNCPQRSAPASWR